MDVSIEYIHEETEAANEHVMHLTWTKRKRLRSAAAFASSIRALVDIFPVWRETPTATSPLRRGLHFVKPWWSCSRVGGGDAEKLGLARRNFGPRGEITKSIPRQRIKFIMLDSASSQYASLLRFHSLFMFL